MAIDLLQRALAQGFSADSRPRREYDLTSFKLVLGGDGGGCGGGESGVDVDGVSAVSVVDAEEGAEVGVRVGTDAIFPGRMR